MDSQPTKSEVEARLRQTAETMSDRMSSLRSEVTSTGTDVRNWIVENPVKSVGGMLAAGLALGLLFGGSRRKRRRQHQKLIDGYLDALTEEVEGAKARGEEPQKALDKALRDRVPLVVYTSEGDGRRKKQAGFFRNLFGETIDVLLSTALSITRRGMLENVLGPEEVTALVGEDTSD